jgi:hypothetical protein
MPTVKMTKTPAALSARHKAALIDEYGELARVIDESTAKLQPAHERHAVLANLIVGWYDAEPAESVFVAEGSAYLLKISAKSRKRTIIDMAKLFARVGATQFLKFCTFPLTAVDKLIEPSESVAFLNEARTGKRTIDPIAKS